MSIRAVFIFEGNDLTVYPSLARMARSIEIYDLDEYLILSDDGTVIGAAADGYQVRLTPLVERRREELRVRLRSYLVQPWVGLDPDLADEPALAAQRIFDQSEARRAPRWWPRLVRQSLVGSRLGSRTDRADVPLGAAGGPRVVVKPRMMRL